MHWSSWWMLQFIVPFLWNTVAVTVPDFDSSSCLCPSADGSHGSVSARCPLPSEQDVVNRQSTGGPSAIGAMPGVRLLALERCLEQHQIPLTNAEDNPQRYRIGFLPCKWLFCLTSLGGVDMEIRARIAAYSIELPCASIQAKYW